MSRFDAFTREERAAIHHALATGAYAATPYPGDCGYWYPKSVYKTCNTLLEELGDDAPGMHQSVVVFDTPEDERKVNGEFDLEDPDGDYHSSRGFTGVVPVELAP